MFIAPECNENEVRLAGGWTRYSGRVEMCLEGMWRSVCYEVWSYIESNIVCKELNYDGCKSLAPVV